MKGIVQLNKEEALKFKDAIDKLCGEANEAAQIAPAVFKDDELKRIKRELARLMEVVELHIIPIYKKNIR